MSEALVEALRPFADMADLIDSETEGMSPDDEFGVYFMGEDQKPSDILMQTYKVAAFYNARAALAAYEAAPGPAVTVNDAVLAALEPLPNRGHKTRYSDSSQYDEVCLECGLTDARGSKHNIGNTDCPKAPTLKDRILAALTPAASPAPSDTYKSALRDACDAVECFFDGLAQEDEWDLPQLHDAIMECARNDL